MVESSDYEVEVLKSVLNCIENMLQCVAGNLCGWDVFQRCDWDMLEMIEMWCRMDWDIHVIYRFWLRCGRVAVEMWKISRALIKLSMRHERGENRKRCFQTNWQILIHVFTFPVSPFKEWFVRFIGVSNNSVELIMIIYHRVMQAILSKNAERRQKHKLF